MKKLLLGSVAILALSAGSSGAADLPVKAPPMVAPPVPMFSWSGCYIGGHEGVGWARKSFRPAQVGDVLATGPTAVPFAGTINASSNLFNANGFLVNSGAFDQSMSDMIAGGQVGCNVQVGRWVFGVDGDFSWSGMRGSQSGQFSASRTIAGGAGTEEGSEGPFASVLTTSGAGTLAVKTDFLATFTGRLGYAWDRLLLYGKGGGAFAHDKYRLASTVTASVATTDRDCFTSEGGVGCSFTATRSFLFNSSQDRWGWTVGAGLEYAFSGNWTAKIEYDYLDFGTKRVSFIDAGGFGSFDVDVRQRIHEVKFGINYLFNWGKGVPVVARY